ncbi:unnamed protein product, partial [Closterium sp. Naga37s-1]
LQVRAVPKTPTTQVRPSHAPPNGQQRSQPRQPLPASLRPVHRLGTLYLSPALP